MLLSPQADANVTVLQALVATTFSVAGAFYQAYNVRARGWGIADVRKGMIDSLAGISVLGGVSVILMSTAAAALHGTDVDPASLTNVSEVARQFEPLFGRYATLVFSTGILAGGFAAFMVNALIGGNMLADGFGFGETMNDRGTKHATVAAAAECDGDCDRLPAAEDPAGRSHYSGPGLDRRRPAGGSPRRCSTWPPGQT